MHVWEMHACGGRGVGDGYSAATQNAGTPVVRHHTTPPWPSQLVNASPAVAEGIVVGAWEDDMRVELFDGGLLSDERKDDGERRANTLPTTPPLHRAGST